VPRFEPFVGLRYDLDRVRADQVIAPPYDVVESAERARLSSRHPANAIAVELPEPDLQRQMDRYQVAAELFSAWRAEGLVVPEAAPALYPYRMTSPDGRTTTGVVGALGLVVPGPEADVLPHEATLPKPRSDRLDLLRATGTNLSPVWGLSMTESLTALFEPTSDPAVSATDDDGVRHELWVVTDRATTDAVGQAVRDSPVVIADGHHRYETALAYQAEVRAANGDRPGPHDLVMALVVELSPDELTVGPIHRTVSGLPEGTDLPAVFAEWFDVARAGDASERVVAALGESRSLALVTADGAWLLSPTEKVYEAAASDLDSSAVDFVLQAVPHKATHRHSWQEAVAALADGEAEAALLLRPPSVEQIAEWAGARRRMPPKTTYFSPKPRTGMVFRPVR